MNSMIDIKENFNFDLGVKRLIVFPLFFPSMFISFLMPSFCPFSIWVIWTQSYTCDISSFVCLFRSQVLSEYRRQHRWDIIQCSWVYMEPSLECKNSNKDKLPEYWFFLSEGSEGVYLISSFCLKVGFHIYCPNSAYNLLKIELQSCKSSDKINRTAFGRVIAFLLPFG